MPVADRSADRLVRINQWAILAACLTIPITIALSEGLVFLAVLLGLIQVIRDRDKSLLKNPMFWPIMVMTVLALLIAAQGIRPAHSFDKCHRFILLMLALAMPLVFRGRKEDGIRLAAAFIVGSSLLGLWDLFRIPIEGMRTGAWFDAGNMRDPQFYLVSLCFLLGLWPVLPWHRLWWATPVLLLLNGAGLVLHNKRGVWIAFFAVVLLMAVVKKKKRLLVAALALVVVVLCFPKTRERIQSLDKVLDPNTGGRRVLWTEVGPSLIREHPLGVGFKGTFNEDLVKHADSYVQPRLDHTHNNLLQVTVELGWLGLAVWLYWAFKVFQTQVKVLRKSQLPEIKLLAQACLFAFAGLMLNGMVEYNFGDTEIMMVMGMLMGLSVWALQAEADPAVA